MLRDCKYRLPCAWCDKYDRECYAVLYEVETTKMQKKIMSQSCEHEWVSCGLTTIKNPTTTKLSLSNGQYKYYECAKCYEHKLEPFCEEEKEECEHEHEWKFELKYQFPEEPERWYNKYFCPKCGTSKVQVEDVVL